MRIIAGEYGGASHFLPEDLAFNVVLYVAEQ